MKTWTVYTKHLICISSCLGLYFPSVERYIPNRCARILLQLLILVPLVGVGSLALGSLKVIFIYPGGIIKKSYYLAVFSGCTLSFYKLVYHNRKKFEFEKIFELWESIFHGGLFVDQKVVSHVS